MKKVGSKLLLTLVLFSMLVLNLTLVFAQMPGDVDEFAPTTGQTNFDKLLDSIGDYTSQIDGSSLPDFFGKWKEGKGLGDYEARIVVLLLVAAITIVALSGFGVHMGFASILGLLIAFVFTSYISPDALTGIFRSYEPFPVAVATMLPLFILFGLSAWAANKGTKPTLTLQLVAWGVYLASSILSLVLFFTEKYTESGFGGPNSWFLMATIVSIIVSALMTFKNGWFMSLAMKSFFSTEELAAKRATEQMGLSGQNLINYLKSITGGS